MAVGLAKEKIYLNTLCPGLTLSGLTEIGKSVYPDHILTPMANHIQAWTEFIDTNIYNYVYEVDGAGLYNRPIPEYWNPEHQSWLDSAETQEMWGKVGVLGAAALENQ